jgi:hypothetical protein
MFTLRPKKIYTWFTLWVIFPVNIEKNLKNSSDIVISRSEMIYGIYVCGGCCMMVSSLEGNQYNMGIKPTILRECHGYTGEVVELIRHRGCVAGNVTLRNSMAIEAR